MANVTEVADGVHRFDASGANVYVIVTDQGLTVVDAGLPGWWGPFSTWLHRSGRTPHEIVALLITHHHADHIGFADRAQTHGADLRIHEDDVEQVQRSGPGSLPPRFSRNLWRPQLIVRMMDWARRGVTRTPALSDVRACSDGEKLDAPGNPRVIHMPGHTPGSAAYAFDDNGVVCTGDALLTRDLATGRKGIGVSPTGTNDDDAQALASLDRLEGVDAILLPGHGEPYLHGVTSALHAARAIGADW
jgi:glyoxylase-like metal-dependent hydrolase (beta-lactamase superfamily II)